MTGAGQRLIRGMTRDRLLIAAAMLAGLAVPVLLIVVRALGRNIPQPAIEPDYVVGVVWAVVLAAGLLLAPLGQADKRALLILWGVKCVVTLLFMLLYEYQYGLDAYTYFRESTIPVRPVGAVSLGQGTELITLLSWYHNQVMPDSYHALKVSFAFMGLMGVYLIYRAAILHRPREGTRLLYFLGLFPSILFWSSVLGKDPLVLLGIGAYAYGVAGWMATHRVRYAVYVIVGIWIAAAIRLWLAPILLLPLAVLGFRGIRGAFTRIALLAVVAIVVSQSFSTIQERIALFALEDLYAKTQQLAGGWGGGSGVELDVKFTSVGSMLTFLPTGIFRALFRPLPGEVMNAFGILAGLENIFLLGLVARALRRVTRKRLGDPMVQWMFAYIIFWSSLYGFVSGNLGSAVRFKMQVLPALLCFLLVLGRRDDEARRDAARPEA